MCSLTLGAYTKFHQSKKGIKIIRLLSIIYFSNESKAGETNKNHFFILLFNRLFSSLAQQIYNPLP
jgi:hypothetical protein